jgi:hypothetical protein
MSLHQSPVDRKGGAYDDKYETTRDPSLHAEEEVVERARHRPGGAGTVVASFTPGTDLLIDAGVVGEMRSGQLQPS